MTISKNVLKHQEYSYLILRVGLLLAYLFNRPQKGKICDPNVNIRVTTIIKLKTQVWKLLPLSNSKTGL